MRGIKAENNNNCQHLLFILCPALCKTFYMDKLFCSSQRSSEEVLGDSSLHGSLDVRMSFEQETLGALTWSIFSRMSIQQTALEDRDSVSLWGRGQSCFLVSIIEIRSPSGTKVGQVCPSPFVRLVAFQAWGSSVVTNPGGATSTWVTLQGSEFGGKET